MNTSDSFEICGDISNDDTLALMAALPEAKVSAPTVGTAIALLANGAIVATGLGNSAVYLGADPDLVSVAGAGEIHRLHEYLLPRTFLKGDSISITDRLVFGLLHRRMATLSADPIPVSLCCVVRWFDYIQFLISPSPSFSQVSFKMVLEKVKGRAPPAPGASGTSAFLSDAASFNIVVGRIVHIEVHPSDPNLYVENIDLGEESGHRQIVSGLAKFVPIEKMQGRDVCALINISPSEIKGVKSSGLVLCASNADHTIVEPIMPPNDTTPGEQIMFPGVPQGTPNLIKPKKLHKLWKTLKTSDDSEPFAVCGDLPFMTSRGRVTAPAFLRSCQIK